MRRTKALLTGALLLLLIPSWAQATVTWYWGMENTSPDDLTLSGTTDYTAGADTTCTVNGTADVNATAALVGSAGLQVIDGSDYCAFNASATVTPTAAGAFAFYFRIQTWVNDASLFYVRANLSANTYIRVTLSSADDLTFAVANNGSSPIALSTVALGLTTNTTYFATFQYDTTANDMRICVYNASGTLLAACTEDLTTDITEPAALDASNGFRWGEVNGSNAALYIDNTFFGNAYADADTFYCNRNITSYASYAACASGSSGASTPSYFHLRVNP